MLNSKELCIHVIVETAIKLKYSPLLKWWNSIFYDYPKKQTSLFLLHNHILTKNIWQQGGVYSLPCVCGSAVVDMVALTADTIRHMQRIYKRLRTTFKPLVSSQDKEVETTGVGQSWLSLNRQEKWQEKQLDFMMQVTVSIVRHNTLV